MKKHSAKRALLLSALALLLCMSMLVGSTFAWFTDSVVSANNKIQAGTLDVQLLMYNGTKYEDISESGKPIFGPGSIAQNNNAETLWEPGKTQVAYLAIKNNGSLALKYQVGLNVVNVAKDLYEVMEYVITPDAQQGGVTSWNDTNAKTCVEGTQIVANNVSLAVGATHYFALSIHMQEEAGNEYQAGEVLFDLTVLATQDTVEEDSFNDQYDAGASFDDVIFALGGTYNMDADRDEGINISPDAEVIVNGNGKVINVDGRGFQNSGDATVNNVTMKAGNAASYSDATSGAGAKTTYNNVTIKSAGGGIGAADGAEVIFNSGSVDVNSTSTSGRYLFYAEGEGTVITINGGNFDFNKTQNQKRAYIYASEGTTVYVNGGTFGKASTREGYSAGIMGDGTVIITGGTFGFDPSNWVADGYKAVKNTDGTWTVTEAPVTPVAPQQTANGIYQVSKPAELAWLAASESKITNATLTADIDMKGATISSIEIASYMTFDGNGHKISNVVVDGNGLFENTSGQITIKNITLDNVTVNATSGDYAGIVSSKFGGFFENVTVLNSKVNASTVKYVGGLAATVYKDMVNCKVENVSVTGAEKVGGLVGFFNLNDVYHSIELKDCSAKNVTVTATNTAKAEAGVIFGRGLATDSWKFTFTNCSAQLKDGQTLIGNDYYSNIVTSAITVTQ